ncbi:hypothetical protein C8F01DRAFT_1073698 [Mycena amicta]|nr:hypothetical protein C8F01DRAFT_1073698 [Mycena amicta]
MELPYLDLEGVCEVSVACSPCHVILPPEYYDLPLEPEDDENDMLGMASGLADTSRLGCQVKLTRELDGITATLPSAKRNMFVDGTMLPIRSFVLILFPRQKNDAPLIILLRA